MVTEIVRSEKGNKDILAKAERLRGGRAALRTLGTEKTAAAWFATVERFRSVQSPERRWLEPRMEEGCGLSREGLRAGLEAILGGVDGEPARRLFEQAEIRRRATSLPQGETGPLVVWLASNLPALAVQPLLPALAAGQPVLLKSPSVEPFFAEAFVHALTEREPRLADAVAACVWAGGDRSVEDPLLEKASRILAYGEASTLEDLELRAPGKVFGFGPKVSLAVVQNDSPLVVRNVAQQVSRDIALFDQRGCLSVVALYVIGGAKEAELWNEALAQALTDRAETWPPGIVSMGTASAIRQVRGEAEMRGRKLLEIDRLIGAGLGAGTVIGHDAAVFPGSPGGRTITVHPLPDPERLPVLLNPWRGRLQGVALHGHEAWALEPALRDLGVSRFAPPGELQSPDALWHNGGVHPLDLMWF